jgi:hypothetical protein
VRADIGGDPDYPDLTIAWKYLWTAKDTWLGPEQVLGGIGALYNLTMDPYEKYDMTFNGAAIILARQVRGSGQRLGLLADLSCADRVRQVDHQISESLITGDSRCANGCGNGRLPRWDEAGNSYTESTTFSRHCNPARSFRKAGPVYQRTGRQCSARSSSAGTVGLSPR